MSLDAAAESRSYFTVATAGHVDHGKTSLLKALTGTDPDRLKEEKERQMTTDLGFAHLTLPSGLEVGFIDVPGHGKFLKNMLAGVGGIDLALLVIAADEGPMPQTDQHAQILSLLGVGRVLLALSKADLTDPRRTEQVGLQAGQLLSRYGLASVACVPVSSQTGAGLEHLVAALSRALAALPLRSDAGPAWLPVDRVFVKSGFGTVVTGTLVRGRLAVGDQVWIEPGSTRARVRRLESLGQQVESAGAGQRVAANLVIKDGKRLTRGQVLLGAACPPTSSLLVGLACLEARAKDDRWERLAGQEVRLYHGTAECHGRLSWTDAGVTTAAGAEVVGQIQLKQPLAAEPGDRYVIRSGDDTIAGGVILMRDRPRWLTRRKAAEIAGPLLQAEYQQALAAFVDLCPQRAVTADDVARFLPPAARRSVIEQALSSGRLVRLGNQLLAPRFREELARRLLEQVRIAGQQKRSEDQDPETAIEPVRAKVWPGADRQSFQMLVQESVEAGLLSRRGDKVILPAAAGNDGDGGMSGLQTDIAALLADHTCLEIDEIARLLGTSPRKVRAAVQAAASLELVAYEFASLESSLRRAHRTLADLWQTRKEISPGAFREALGVSRKYAMAMLAYFDDQHVTRRLPHGRTLLKPPRD